eukprot:TRINITY_DN79_c0_g1_i2.p1 TRINITY_DN79_c0_g1~~TRINITY_DN79_c0_g1_i2.p1  ORF type:complete len:273 (-),score=88.60 TRINITY_DN79_c0_g1_i2:67-885(-)
MPDTASAGEVPSPVSSRTLIDAFNTTNNLTRDVSKNLISIGDDIKKMQELNDKLEEEHQKVFIGIIHTYNKILCDISNYSAGQRRHLNQIKLAVRLRNVAKFRQAVKHIDLMFIELISKRINDLCTDISNFGASLKITKRKIYKNWRFWLSVAMGAISAVAAVLTLSLSVWVELGIAVAIVGGLGAVGVGTFWLVNHYHNSKRMEHLEELKETLQKANKHMYDVKDMLNEIGDRRLPDIIEEMFNEPDFATTVDEAIDSFNQLDNLLKKQIM